MSFAKKTMVAVLRGGPSSEYEISLKSGERVLKSLPEKYTGIDVFISLNGDWYVAGIKRHPADILKHVDVAFVAMHGQYGEDGKIQHVLEHIGVPFTGSKALASAIAMNKHMTKESLSKIKDKVKMASHKTFSRKEIESKGMEKIFREIPHPSIVKPLSAGSSLGITIVREYFDLEKGIVSALKHGDSVIIEELIEGREATCDIIEGFRGENHYALLPVEVVPPKSSPFFDYEAKYTGSALEICPGNFDEETKIAIQEAAKAVHGELGLRHYSASDFIIHQSRGVYFIEVNTLPGLTPESLLPKSLDAVGSSLTEFLDHVITLALERK